MKHCRKLNILVIEDNLGDYDLIVEYLSESYGDTYDLMNCESLEEAEIQLRVSSVDVILLDLALPDSVGVGTVCITRKMTAKTPIVVLTGLDSEDIGEQAIQQGAQEYVTKSDLNGKVLNRAIKYAIQRKQMDEKLEVLAHTDPLTGLFNRRHLYEFGWNEFIRARRYDLFLSFILIDLDLFKSVNDQYGHCCGDAVLCKAAAMILKSVRGIDMVARYGGEEFIVLAPETDVKGVQHLAERIRDSIEKMSVEWEGITVRVTASLGIAMLDIVDGKFQDLIDQADKALYLAKEKGRNRVEVFGCDSTNVHQLYK